MGEIDHWVKRYRNQLGIWLKRYCGNRLLDVNAWLGMEANDPKSGDHYNPVSSEILSEVEEYEFDYDHQQGDIQNNDISYIDWSSPVNDEAVPSREETSTTSPPFSPPPVIPKIAEKGKGPYFCDLCNKTFTNYGSYRRHLRMHYCEKKYTCHICGRQFFRRYLWVKHQEKIHGNDPSSCRCPHCGDWSQTPDLLREHLRTQHKRTNGCKENWTKEQGTFPKGPPVPALPLPTPKKPKKKKATKGSPAKEKRIRKSATTDIVIKKEVDSLIVNPVAQDSEEEVEETPSSTKNTSHETENSFVDVVGNGTDSSGPIGEGDLEEIKTENEDSQCPRNMSRYGRKRKQRILFNTDTYRTSLKRFKRTSISSPGEHRKSIDNANSNGIVGEENEEKSDTPNESDDKIDESSANKIDDCLLIEPKVEVDLEGEAEVEEESELSKLLQQALPNNIGMPKNVSHRGNFFCDKCRRFFINRSSYMRHKKMHTGVKPFTCEYCCLSFFRSESLTNHKKKHAKDNFSEFRCHLCGYKAANCASLRNHFYTVCSRDKANGERKGQGDSADNEENDQAQPNGDENIQNGSRNIAGYCSLCNRAFFNLSNYKKHAKLHSTMATAVPMQLTYTCSFCGKIFTNRAKYDGHVLAHSKENNSNAENGAPSSLEVLKLFGTLVSQQNDASEVRVKEEPTDEEPNADASASNVLHENPRVLCCRLCPLAFTDRKTFLTHQQTHTRGNEASYSFYCRYCGHPFKSKSDASTHEGPCYATRKNENRLHHCYNCEVKFDNGSALREHVKAAHSNDRVEMAQRENSETTGEDNGTVKVVDNEAANAGKYKCGKCNVTFTDIQSVVGHIQNCHEEAANGNSKRDNENASWEANGESSTSIMKQLLSSPAASSSRYAGNYSSNKSGRNRSFTCSLCLKAFDDPRVAEAHEQQAHVMVDWFQCALCEKTGGKKTMLCHMATHMLKIGSVVTTVGDQEQESEMDSLNIGTARGGIRQTEFKKPSNIQVPSRENQPQPQFVSMFCQLCKKVISSLSTLERHRHASQDNNISFPYVCCMPGCGKCFALKVEALAHLQTLHKGSLNPSVTNNAQPTPLPKKTTKPPSRDTERNRTLLANAWKGLLAGGVGPFSQSLVQLSMAVAGNESEPTRGSTGKKDGNVIDIYQEADALESLTNNGELTITKVGDAVEEIMVEPLLDCVLEEDGVNNEESEVASPEREESVVIPLSPTMLQDDLDDGELAEDDASPMKDDRCNSKNLLQCEDCDSVFTNPCSWKRHRKLHLGIMKHKCSFCPRKFYRKDHCDKHVKTHENFNVPRRKKSSVDIKIELDTL